MKFRTKLILFTSTFIILLTTISIYIISDRLIQSRLDASIENAIGETNQVKMMVMSLMELDSYVDFDVIEKAIYRNNESDEFYKLILVEEESSQIMQFGTYKLMSENDRYYIEAYTKIKIGQSSYILIGKHDISSLIEESDYSQRFILTSSIIMVIFVVIMSTIFSSKFTKNIKRLEEASKDMIAGNYNQEVTIKSNDELADLGKSFNQMSNKTQTLIKELKSSVQKNKQLYGALTHEINTPLTSIIGYSELLLTQPYDAELSKRSLKHIYEEGKRLSVLSENLLALSNEKLSRELSSIKELLNKSIKTCLSGSRKSITYDILGEDIVVLVDKNLMTAVIINIVKNAVDSIIMNGQLEFILTKTELIIIDNGMGISPDKIETLFDSFYKGNDDSNHLGLGLTLVKDILDLHGDEISIESNEKGTRMTISFTTSIQLTDNFDVLNSYTVNKEVIL